MLLGFVFLEKEKKSTYMEVFMRDPYGIRHAGLFFGFHDAAPQGYDTLGMNQSTPISQSQVSPLTINQLNHHPWSLLCLCPALDILGGVIYTAPEKQRDSHHHHQETSKWYLKGHKHAFSLEGRLLAKARKWEGVLSRKM